MPSPPAITPILVAELLVEGERRPVCVHVIDHPDARVLGDTGMTELHPAVADLDPRLHPLSEQAFDLAGIDVVVSTHLHFDHHGGNHLFVGRPIYVQRRELDDARTENDYTIREWIDAPGSSTCRSTVSSSYCRGSGSSRHRATRAARRWSWSRQARVRSSSAATWRCASPSSSGSARARAVAARSNDDAAAAVRGT